MKWWHKRIFEPAWQYVKGVAISQWTIETETVDYGLKERIFVFIWRTVHANQMWKLQTSMKNYWSLLHNNNRTFNHIEIANFQTRHKNISLSLNNSQGLFHISRINNWRLRSLRKKCQNSPNYTKMLDFDISLGCF